MQRKKIIPRTTVPDHDCGWVGGIDYFCYVYLVAFESCVGLVSGQKEFVIVANPHERVAKDDFSEIPDVKVIAYGDLTKT